MAIAYYAQGGYRGARPLYRGVQLVWYVLGILETLLAFRFLLRMLAANPNAGFTEFIYNVTYPFVAPFLAVFGISRVSTGNVIEWTTLLAMAVYWLMAWAIVKLFAISRPVTNTDAAVRLEEEDQ